MSFLHCYEVPQKFVWVGGWWWWWVVLKVTLVLRFGPNHEFWIYP